MDDHVPEPTIVMTGPAAWDSTPFGPDDPCPVCGQGIKRGDDNVYCARCDSASPALESKLRKAKAGVKVRDRAERAKRELETKLRKLARGTLSESTRRRIYNGYKGGILAENEDICNVAREGREFLRRINQMPDWSLDLRKKKDWRDGLA